MNYDETIVLVNDNGEEEEFEYLDTIEMNGNEYVVLVPVEFSDYEGTEDEEELDDIDYDDVDIDEDEEDEDEVVILKLVREGEEESLVSIENEEELYSVFEEFRKRNEEMDS